MSKRKPLHQKILNLESKISDLQDTLGYLENSLQDLNNKKAKYNRKKTRKKFRKNMRCPLYRARNMFSNKIAEQLYLNVTESNPLLERIRGLKEIVKDV